MTRGDILYIVILINSINIRIYMNISFKFIIRNNYTTYACLREKKHATFQLIFLPHFFCVFSRNSYFSTL